MKICSVCFISCGRAVFDKPCPQEIQEVTAFHELENEILLRTFEAHTQQFHNVWVIEVAGKQNLCEMFSLNETFPLDIGGDCLGITEI